MRRRATLAVIVSLFPLPSSLAVAQSVVGRWLGTAVAPTDSISLAFEIKPDSTGALKVFLYEPWLNFYGLELPGTLTPDSAGTGWVLPEYASTFTLHGDTLGGTFMAPFAPMHLTRTKKLPVEPPLPKIPAGPGPTWRVKLDAPIYAPAAIQDGVAYVGTTGGVFNAVTVATGKIVWKFSAGRPMYGEPLATDSAVYFTCENGWLFKLDRQTGKELWRYDLGGSRTSRILPNETVYDYDIKGTRPLLLNGTIYVGSGDSSFHAVNASTGARVWRTPTRGTVRTSAILSGRDLFFGDMSGMLYALDPATGRERWHKDSHSMIVTTPGLIDGRLIVGLWHGMEVALDPDSGKVLWRMGLWGSAGFSDAVNDDGLTLVGASDLQAVSVIDTRTGRLIWRTDLFGWTWSRPAIAGDIVFEGVASGNPYQMKNEASFAALDRKTGRILWRWPMPEWPGAYTNGFAGGAAIADGLAIIGGLDGTLYAFPVTAK